MFLNHITIKTATNKISPITSANKRGYSRQNPDIKIIILNNTGSLPQKYKYPPRAFASKTDPKIAVVVDRKISPHGPINIIEGLKTNKNGIMNEPTPNRIAKNPDRIGGAPAIDEDAIVAIATGGVI